MKKYLGLIFVVGIVWFFVFYEGPYSQFSNKGITPEDNQYIGEVVENQKIVENEKLFSFFQNEYSDLVNKLNARNEQCQKNAQEFFKNSPPEIYVETNILRSLDFVFKNTLEREIAEKLYNKMDDIIKAGIVSKPKRTLKFMKNIEICRPKKSLKYISSVLDKILKFKKENIKKITSFLIYKIDTVLIGELDSLMNLKLGLDYLAKMEGLGFIKGDLEKKKYQLEIFEKECIYKMKNAKNNEELVNNYQDCRGNLRKLAALLKTGLKSFKLK